MPVSFGNLEQLLGGGVFYFTAGGNPGGTVHSVFLQASLVRLD